MTRNNTPWEEDSVQVNDADGNLAFEVIDLVKPDKLVPTYVKGAEYSDWRKELEESWSNITTGNKVGQTFLHVPSGTTVSTGGAIGGVETIPAEVIITADGESFPIAGPDISSYAIQGYAVPFPGLIRKTKFDDKEPVNTRLDASEKVAKKANADVMMRARIDEFLEKEKNIAKENDKIREANRAKAAAYVSSKGFSWDKLEKEGALVDDKGYGIVIINGTPGGKIMTGKIKIGYGRPYTRKDTTQDGEFLGRKNSKGEWYYPNIPEMEARDGSLYKGMPVGKPVEIDLEKGVKEIPSMPPELAKLHAKDQMTQDQLYDDGAQQVKNYNLDDNDRFDQLADKVGVSVSKDMFDYYMDKFVDNPTDQNINMNRIFKPHLNTIKSYLPRIEEEIKLGLINGYSIDKIQKDVNNFWNDVISPRMPADLRNSLGNGSQPDVKQYLKTGNWQINKSFVFTEPKDFQGRDLGPGGVLNFAPSLYARGKSIQKGTGGDLRPYVNVPMKYNVTIPGSKTSTTPISKSKRSSISLDEPIVRGKSKTKKSNWRSELNGN